MLHGTPPPQAAARSIASDGDTSHACCSSHAHNPSIATLQLCIGGVRATRCTLSRALVKVRKTSLAIMQSTHARTSTLSPRLAHPPRAHPISRRCTAPHTDGTGAMPIGNGDGTSSVWVDAATGDLRLLLSKSDVFDESGQPVKTGVLRMTFDPPLWKGSPVSMYTVRQSIRAHHARRMRR
jgi:hypothetical protein